ncbi:MAG: OPT family oligopeptide transporter [Kofleriaceae bacterium]
MRLTVDPATAATEDPEARWLRDTYRPDEPNLTLRCVIVGVLIGAVMCLSNLYVFFKTGWSLGVTLTACIIAFGTFQLLQRTRIVKRPLGALENNALTTVASGAGYMTAGGNMAAYGALLMVLTPPLLVPYMWDALEGTFLLSREPQAPPNTLMMMVWFGVIAAMGVFVAIPIKRQLINKEGLAFPTGTATAETIRSIHNTGSSGARTVKWLGLSALFAAVVKFLIGGLKLIPEEFSLLPFVELGGHALKSWTLSLKTEVVLVAAGALMSFRTGWSLLLGGILNYAVLAPILHANKMIPAVTYKGILTWTLWPGAAILVSAGLTSFALDYKALGRAFSGLTKAFRTSKVAETGIAAVEAPGWWFPVGFFLLVPVVILLMGFMFGIPAWAGVLAAVLAILMGFVAARVTGETDITPTKALGPVTQMTFGAVTPGNLHGNIMAANVTGGIGLHAADLLTTMKTGWLLGAKPRHQVYAQLVGVVAGAMFIVPAFNLIIPDPRVLGDTEWPAPSCVIWESVSRAFANGIDSLDSSIKIAMLVGVAIGIGLSLAEKFAPKRARTFIPSANGLGISMVIPGGNSIAMFVGALIAEIQRRRGKDQLVVPIASGLIAGESIMGVVIAMLVSFEILPK